MSVAEDATQRNVELESELENCKQELDRLKQGIRDRDHRANQLISANEELCSIIRHALEDMKRANVDLTNALHDRIQRHAPIALIPPVPFQGPSNAYNSSSYAPAGIPYEQSNVLPAVSSIANDIDRRAGAPMDTFSLPGPATKRRRGEAATHDDALWNCPNSRTYLPGSERSGPIQNDYNANSTGPATGALASIETSVQAAFAGLASSHQVPQLDSMPSQNYYQQASAEAHNDTTQPIGHHISCGDARPDSPVLGFESSSRHNVASPPLPQLMAGEQFPSTPDLLSWMEYEQTMTDDFFARSLT